MIHIICCVVVLIILKTFQGSDILLGLTVELENIFEEGSRWQQHPRISLYCQIQHINLLSHRLRS